MELIIPAFIAGMLTFLAPCTFPLLPAYISFISGTSIKDIKNIEKTNKIKLKIFYNGLFYVLGFSLVFIVLGSLFGLGGSFLIKYRIWVSRIGGAFVILFGLYILNIIKLPNINISIEGSSYLKKLQPGNALSSFILGVIFAMGWTPCVGPILGSVLLLASSTATLAKGALLLAIFSLGLALPFLIIAIGFGWVTEYLKKINKYLNIISIIAGIFLLIMGLLLITNNFAQWNAFFYNLFNFLNYEKIIINYL